MVNDSGLLFTQAKSSKHLMHFLNLAKVGLFLISLGRVIQYIDPLTFILPSDIFKWVLGLSRTIELLLLSMRVETLGSNILLGRFED